MNPVSIESPFPLHAIPRVWAWSQDSLRGKADDAAPKSLDDFIEWWVKEEARPGRRSWAVLCGGVIGGVFFSSRLTEYVADLHVLFKREFYGHKRTQPALAMVLEDLYAPEGEPGIIKIESKVLPENRAVIGLVMSVGGSKEGLARGHTLRNGEPIDVVMVGIERSKFNVFNRRRLQLAGHEQPVSEHRDDQPQSEPAAGGDLARHLRGVAPIPYQSTGSGQPGQDGSAQPGQ